MSKSILLTLFASAVIALTPGSSFAGGRAYACKVPCVATVPACAASVPPGNAASGTPANPPAGMTTSQANSSPNYQSFSYEPRESQAVAIPQAIPTAPRPTLTPSNRTYRQSPSLHDTVRGDRKVRGLYGLQ